METIERPLTSVSAAEFSDPDLLAALRRGDSDALAKLYDRYHAFVFRASNRMLEDADAAEDVVQNVFLSLWSTPPETREGALAAWLITVAKNRSRDVLRARASRREAAYPLHLVDLNDTSDIVYLRLLHARVRTAIESLPSNQRLLIELGFYGERTHAEIAELLQLPLGTIKTRIRSGLRKLRWSIALLEGESA